MPTCRITPNQAGVVSMTKVKNALRHERPDLVPTLRNVRVNEQLRGCSGFISDPATGKVVYINTETGISHKALYRTAEHTRDFRGGQNQFCLPSDIVEHAVALLVDDAFYLV